MIESGNPRLPVPSLVDPGGICQEGVPARLNMERIGQVADHMGSPAMVLCWMTQELYVRPRKLPA